MMLEDLRSYILADSDVAGRIADRFYPNAAAASPTSPYCVYRVISESVDNTHDAVEAAEELHEDMLQIDVYGATYASVTSVKEALFARLNNATAVQGNTNFEYIEWEDAFSDYEVEAKEHFWTITIGVMWGLSA